MSGTRSITRPTAAPGGVAGGYQRRLGLALLVIATAQLMVVLDSKVRVLTRGETRITTTAPDTPAP